jgi:hypothetical protein
MMQRLLGGSAKCQSASIPTAWLRFFVASLLVCGFGARDAVADDVTLQDHSLLVSFDSNSGALTRMEDKVTHWVIERRPELGISFRLFAPLPDRRWNPVYGPKQRAEVTKVSDNEVQIKWNNLQSENGGVLPMTFSADVTLNHGILTFKSMLQNDSQLTVETIDYPYFGDFNPPSRQSSLTVLTMKNGKRNNIQQEEVYPHFSNHKGYWGVFYPTKTMNASTRAEDAWESPICLLQAQDEGLYVQMDEPKPLYRVEYTFEQHPGVMSGITQSVPQEDEVPGEDALWGPDENAENSKTPVYLVFRTCHFVFAPPTSTTHLTPVVVRCYAGDMQAGKDLYKQAQAQ